MNTAAETLKKAEKACIVYGSNFTAKADNQTLDTLLALSKALDAALLGVKGNANSLAAAQLGLDKPININGCKAAFIMLGDEVPTQKLIKTFEDIPFVIAQAAYGSQLTGNADVVLPVTMWAEHSGTFLNMDGRLQGAGKSLEAPAGVLTSQETLKKIADTLSIEPELDWKSQLNSRVSPVSIKDAESSLV